MSTTYTIMEHIYASGYDEPVESQVVFLSTSKQMATQKLEQLREQASECGSQRFVSAYELTESE